MSEIYPEQDSQQRRVNYYKRTVEMLSVPEQYYYDDMRKKLGTEFRQIYVEKNTYAKFCGALLLQIEVLKTQMAEVNERLAKVEKCTVGSNAVEEEPQQLAVIPEQEATERIATFINDHPGARTSEIIFELGLDPDLTLRV